MDLDQYIEKMSEHLSAADRQRLSQGRVKQLPEAPLGNFFRDDLFTLIYQSADACPPHLISVRQHLVVVSQKGPRHIRAAAALALGRFLQRRGQSEGYQEGSSRPIQWFELARDLNSVVAAAEVANVLLAEDGQRVEFDLCVDPLPKLVHVEGIPAEGEYEARVSRHVAQAWYLGARVGLRHIQRGFSNWDRESFSCALSCVVNYLTLLPSRRRHDLNCPVARRREALQWIKPYWNKLIVAASAATREPQAYRDALVEQQLAVLLHLEHDDSSAEKRLTVRSSAKAAKSASRKPRVNEAIIVQGEIAAASDRTDAEYLKRFEVLREPMAFTPFPPLSTLKAMHETLRAEFPWASDAISLVMSDLYARKRHGVLRLGMAPLLLVGAPGTGKTRFAQRLGELLGTADTVINLAGMVDVKVLKGVTRGWASNRPSRMVEFIQQTSVPNPLFILDEIDKATSGYSNGGDPQDALLDMLEPGNARRYHDVYLMTECDLSHCLYIATSNTLATLSEPLLSRLRPVLFPAPGPEHADVILKGIVRDLEQAWGLPANTIVVPAGMTPRLQGLSAREMRRALLEVLGHEPSCGLFHQH